jgi:hypothetical protein
MLYSLLLRDSLAFRVDVPESVRAGEPVRMAVRLTNKTERVLTLALRGGGRAFDLTAARADGTVVWQVLHEGTVSKGPGARPLEPAESLVFEESWDGPAAGDTASPDRYLVAGTLFIEGEEPLVTRPAQIELFSSPPGSA